MEHTDHTKHALLLFTKSPVVGRVKTRLTVEHGGILTPDEATDLYCRMLLDVTEIGFVALGQLGEAAAEDGGTRHYDFFVSSSPAAEQKALRDALAAAGPWPAEIRYLVDSGTTFDEHFDDAFGQLFAAGYLSVVAIGGDLPTMPPGHVVAAFQWLHYFSSWSGTGGFVQAPCQECGVSLVGYTRDTPMDSTGVFYNLLGVPALDAYIAKAAERQVPVACLDPVADVDTTGDLAHATSLIRAVGYARAYQPDVHVPRRTLAWIDDNGLRISTPPNTEHDPRESLDL